MCITSTFIELRTKLTNISIKKWKSVEVTIKVVNMCITITFIEQRTKLTNLRDRNSNLLYDGTVL